MTDKDRLDTAATTIKAALGELKKAHDALTACELENCIPGTYRRQVADTAMLSLVASANTLAGYTLAAIHYLVPRLDNKPSIEMPVQPSIPVKPSPTLADNMLEDFLKEVGADNTTGAE